MRIPVKFNLRTVYRALFVRVREINSVNSDAGSTVPFCFCHSILSSNTAAASSRNLCCVRCAASSCSFVELEYIVNNN